MITGCMDGRRGVQREKNLELVRYILDKAGDYHKSVILRRNGDGVGRCWRTKEKTVTLTPGEGRPRQRTNVPRNLSKAFSSQTKSLMDSSALPLARKSSFFHRSYSCLGTNILVHAHA